MDFVKTVVYSAITAAIIWFILYLEIDAPQTIMIVNYTIAAFGLGCLIIPCIVRIVARLIKADMNAVKKEMVFWRFWSLSICAFTECILLLVKRIKADPGVIMVIIFIAFYLWYLMEIRVHRPIFRWLEKVLPAGFREFNNTFEKYFEKIKNFSIIFAVVSFFMLMIYWGIGELESGNNYNGIVYIVVSIIFIVATVGMWLLSLDLKAGNTIGAMLLGFTVAIMGLSLVLAGGIVIIISIPGLILTWAGVMIIVNALKGAYTETNKSEKSQHIK